MISINMYVFRAPLSLSLQHFKVCEKAWLWKQGDSGASTLPSFALPCIILLDLQCSMGVFLLTSGAPGIALCQHQESTTYPTS